MKLITEKVTLTDIQKPIITVVQIHPLQISPLGDLESDGNWNRFYDLLPK